MRCGFLMLWGDCIHNQILNGDSKPTLSTAQSKRRHPTLHLLHRQTFLPLELEKDIDVKSQWYDCRVQYQSQYQLESKLKPWTMTGTHGTHTDESPGDLPSLENIVDAVSLREDIYLDLVYNLLKSFSRHCSSWIWPTLNLAREWFAGLFHMSIATWCFPFYSRNKYWTSDLAYITRKESWPSNTLFLLFLPSLFSLLFLPLLMGNVCFASSQSPVSDHRAYM